MGAGGALTRPLRIALCGGGAPDDTAESLAGEVGRAVAAAGAVLVCGGRGGCMAAASRAAAEHGGQVIGVLPGTDPAEANPHVTLPLPTGMGEARNALVVRFAEAVVAVGGAWGTLSEIGLARAMGVPVIVLAPTLAAGLDLPEAPDAATAVAWALEAARARRVG